MSLENVTIRLEEATDVDAVEIITKQIFGPGMKARAAYALREGVAHEAELSFVAELGEEMVGTVRLTRILIGETKVLMLGPLGVLPKFMNNGLGSRLMENAISAARIKAEQGGERVVMLVGDLAYYQPFGFERAPSGSIFLPRPVDPNRILLSELVEGAKRDLSGIARRCR